MQTSNQQDILSPNNDFEENEKVPRVDQHHTAHLAFVTFTLTMTAAVSLWIMQNSVNAYYQQTYHKESPLVALEPYKAWTVGGEVGDFLYAQHGRIKSIIQSNNSQLIEIFNQDYAYTAEYKAYLAEKARLETIRLAEEAKKQEQLAIQNQFTLTKSDQVFFAGDSLMQGVAPHVQKLLLEKYDIKTVNLSKQSTGLSYPKFFDWPKTIRETLENNPAIKVLVVFLGPNDPWDMPNPAGGQYLRFKSPEWEQLYRSRIADIIETAKQHHVSVMWLTPPNMKKQMLNQQMMYLNALIEDEVLKHKAFAIDSRPLLGGKGEVYSDYLEKNGQPIKVRSADGIHFSPQGQKAIADVIAQNLKVIQ